MGCCGGGVAPLRPKREPYITCDGSEVTFAPDALIILASAGVDPCSVTGTGRDGLVTRNDALRAAGRL